MNAATRQRISVTIGGRLLTTDTAARFGELLGVDCIELKP